MIVAFFSNVKETTVQHTELDFPTLANVFEGLSRQPKNRADKEGTESFIPAIFSPKRRSKTNVQFRHAFGLDVDGDREGHLQFDQMVELLDALDLNYIVHTTTKSTNAINRYRVILPCEPLSVEDYEAACSSLDQALSNGKGVFDTKTYDASRLNFVPQDWYGLPKDTPDFPLDDAHQAFRSRTDGKLVPVQDFIAAFPPLPPETKETVVEEFDLETFFATRVVTSKHDWWTLADLDQSPLVTQQMRDEYVGSPEGGRYFKFLCRCAARALYRGLPCEPDIIHALGEQMNARGCHSKRRSLREARRAVSWAVANHQPTPDPTTSALHAALKRMKQRKKK